MSYSTAKSTMVQYPLRTLRQSRQYQKQALKQHYTRDVITMQFQCLTRKLRQCLDKDIETLWKSGIESTL